MNECVSDVKAVACFIDSHLNGATDPWALLRSIDEPRLIKILSNNKVAFAFERKIISKNSTGALDSYPRVKSFFNDLNNKKAKDSLAFSQIKNLLSQNDIDFLLIKSEGFFPYESDNIDVLIKPRMLGKVADMLKNAGYTEFPQVRERNKYLFRNLQAYDVLPLHIHTRVEWEGTQFIDSSDLWSRCVVSSEEGGFLAPSPEDCILITVAHLFFENHTIKLADLFKITSAIRDNKLDWNYMLDHARRLHWDDAFCLTILLCNLLHKDLCGRNMLEQKVLSVIEEAKPSYVNLFQKILKLSNSDFTPLTIPYNFAVLFFIRRVLYDSSASLTQRFKHVDWIASNVLREKVVRMSYS